MHNKNDINDEPKWKWYATPLSSNYINCCEIYSLANITLLISQYIELPVEKYDKETDSCQKSKLTS